MKIAIHGLGRMGNQIAHKLASDPNISVIAHNRSPQPIDLAIEYGAIGAYNKQEVLANFINEPVIIWLMLPSIIVDEQLDEWLGILPKDSILIDGGNSDYRLTKQRAERIHHNQLFFIDVGVSGGVWGFQNGFSMMAGGDQDAFNLIKPVMAKLAEPEGAYRYFGESGSGHFVKMTHNAIEYGMMESLAEGYNFLKNGPYSSLNLADAADVWQHHSVITSWLNELCLDVLTDNPTLNGIEGFVAESGEARWTLESAEALKIDMPSIKAAFNVRIKSAQGQVNYATKLLAAMRNKFGGHQLNK